MRALVVLVLACLTAMTAPALAQAPGTRTIPPTFKIVWMRGLVIADDPKGAVVVQANDSKEVGTIFTAINNQPVRNAADLLAKLNAADIKTVSITSERITQNTTPFYVDAWLEALRYSDTPTGVRIDASAYDDAGQYLTRINDQPIRNAAQLRSILLNISRDVSLYRSRSFRSPTAADKAAAAKMPRPSPPPGPPADVRARWGALALLPGKTWYCVASEPPQWLQRRRVPTGNGMVQSLSVARLTTAMWLDGYTAMEVHTQQGNDRWTDRIVLRPDGSFALTTTGLSAFTNLVGTKRPSGEIAFRLGTYKWKSSTIYNFLTFYGVPDRPGTALAEPYDPREPFGAISNASCDMEEFDEIKLPRLNRNLEYVRGEDAKWIESARITAERIAEEQAEGARRLAGMRASVMNEFLKIGDVVRQQQEQRADLNRLRVAAEQETAQRRTAQASQQGGLNMAGGDARRPPTQAPARSTGGGGIVVANVAPKLPARPVGGGAGSMTGSAPPIYYSCIGTTKRRMPNGGDGIDTSYYGIVTSRGGYNEGAKDLFRQQTGSRGATDTENAGTVCTPFTSRSDAVSHMNGKITRDSKGGWRQVTGIELSI